MINVDQKLKPVFHSSKLLADQIKARKYYNELTLYYNQGTFVTFPENKEYLRVIRRLAFGRQTDLESLRNHRGIKDKKEILESLKQKYK